jgi:hypothetical protein
MYSDGEPVQNQLDFSLLYQPMFLIRGLFSEITIWMGWLLLAILAFILPGWVILNQLWGKNTLGVFVKTALSAGISLAIYPLLLLWTDLVGVHLGVWNAVFPLLVGVFYLFYRVLRYRRELPAWVNRLRNSIRGDRFWFYAAFVLVLGGIIFSRFWAIRAIELPLWGDSVQHATITQLILDQGGLFTSWEPYAPYQTLTVQYGFAALSAVFAWLTGYSGAYAALVTGQILNILAIVCLYPLSVKVAGGKPWAGLVAMLVAGVLSPMPAFYVNWGRYAQLAGQAVLPVAVWLIWESLDGLKNTGWKQVLLIGTVLAGMALSYYRMVLYFGFFALAILLVYAISKWRLHLDTWKQFVLKMTPVILIAFVWLLPWVLRVSGSILAQSLETGLTRATPVEIIRDDYRGWLRIGESMPTYLLLLGGLSLLVGLIKRNWALGIVALWAVFLAGFKALQLVNFPAANMMQSFAVIIALYIPISLGLGWFSVYLADLIPSTSKKSLLLFLVTLLALAPGVNQARKIVSEPAFAMAKHPDIVAMQWIRQNTPPDALFLVEGFTIYWGTAAVGADGGWYIPLLTGRANTMPPQYALWAEAPRTPGYSAEVVALVTLLEQAPLDSPEALAALCDWQITHVYVGQDHGMVHDLGRQLYALDELQNEYFTRLYARDRVRIFAFNREWCQAE